MVFKEMVLDEYMEYEGQMIAFVILASKYGKIYRIMKVDGKVQKIQEFSVSKTYKTGDFQVFKQIFENKNKSENKDGRE